MPESFGWLSPNRSSWRVIAGGSVLVSRAIRSVECARRRRLLRQLVVRCPRRSQRSRLVSRFSRSSTVTRAAASVKQAYDDKARGRLFAKINRFVARLERKEAAKAAVGPSPDAAEVQSRGGMRRLMWIRPQAIEKA